MLRRYSIAEAKNKLTKIVRDVEQTEPVEFTRHGKTVAVLMSAEEYSRLQKRGDGFWDSYLAFREAFELESLDIKPELFTDVRDTSSGREINL